jgi:hypothetical protein
MFYIIRFYSKYMIQLKYHIICQCFLDSPHSLFWVSTSVFRHLHYSSYHI